MVIASNAELLLPVPFKTKPGLADMSKEANNKNTPQMGLPWSKCLGRRREISRPSPALSPLATHSLGFAKFLFLKINLKARLPEMSYKEQLSAQVAFDNAKQLGANKVTTLQSK